MSQETTKCGCHGAGPLVTEFLRKLGPSDDVSQHFRNARLEILKGLRAMLDEQIEGMSKPPKQGTKITVE
ncbi:MAG: hypothetical protein HYX27_23640 [Acidobacteria bacterium]|nr:hypothetical protein [Acidobacteriota bacterium]